MRALVNHLTQNPRIRLVWHDYSCLPQGERSDDEDKAFKRQLRSVNLLYLGCSVLILLDLAYLSRFWTQVDMGWDSVEGIVWSLWARELPCYTPYATAGIASHHHCSLRGLADRPSCCYSLLC